MSDLQPLGTLLKTMKGRKPRTLYDDPAPGRVPYIDISAVELGTRRQWADPAEARVVPEDTLVMVWDGARSGWVGFTKFEGALGSTLAALESPLDKRYLASFLRTNFANINSNHRGSGIPHVNPDFLKGLEIPVLPDHEQQIFADVYDAVSDKAKSAELHLVVAQNAIDRFRQAVLSTSYRQAFDSADEHVVSLDQLLREPLKNGYSARPVSQPTPYRVLTLTATTSGWFNGNHFKYTDEQFASDSPFWLSPGDIVVQRGNTAEYVGVPALYDGLYGEYLYPDLMIRVRVRDDIDPRFVWYMLLAPQARNFLRERATGSAGNMPKINQTALKQVPIPLPSEQVRKQIVEQLDRAISLTDGISRHLEVASLRVDYSSRAVLSKAFRGELSSNSEVLA